MREAATCPGRRVIDEATATALAVSTETVADWRHRLAREPTVSNNLRPSTPRRSAAPRSRLQDSSRQWLKA